MDKYKSKLHHRLVPLRDSKRNFYIHGHVNMKRGNLLSDAEKF